MVPLIVIMFLISIAYILFIEPPPPKQKCCLHAKRHECKEFTRSERVPLIHKPHLPKIRPWVSKE